MVHESQVVVLTGARQVGKSTLILHELKDGWQYFSVDDLDIQAQLKKNPELILEASDQIILDEVQKVPEIFPSIKLSVDRNPQKRFVLSGSANMALMSRISESLAGRAEYLDLEPMSRAEMEGKGPSEVFLKILGGEEIKIEDSKQAGNNLSEEVWKGGMPIVLQRNNLNGLVRWREGYIISYLERDLRQLSQIENLADFKKLMQVSALHAGKILNQSEMARDIGLTQPTTHRYLNLLEISRLMIRLAAYRTSRTVRLVKSPKIMWVDSGIACHLAGFFTPGDLIQSREWGNFLECFVFGQLKALAALLSPKPTFYYWRTQKGDEVDLVIEYGKNVIPVEIKGAKNAMYQDTRGLQAFLEYHPDTRIAILLYAGSVSKKMGKNICAVPISMLWV